jgi:hypothetical protein
MAEATVASPPACWASLPQEVVRHCAARLPPDARLAVAATCGSWRDALRSPRCWRVLDASVAGGCAVLDRSLEAVLCAASRRARGTLEELNLAGRSLPQHVVDALLWAHTGALRTVQLQSGSFWVPVDELERMLTLAGDHSTLHACVSVWLPLAHDTDTVLRLVEDGRLVLHGLQLLSRSHAGDDAAAAAAASLLRALCRQNQRDVRIDLTDLQLGTVPAAARDAVVDALAACEATTEVCVSACGLGAEALLPALAPLGGLRTLAVCDEPGLLLDGAPAHAALAEALRRSGATLTHVRLRNVCAAGGSATDLVRTVTAAALPALKQLQLCNNGTPAEQAEQEEEEHGHHGGEDSYPDDSSDEDVAHVARSSAEEAAEAAACASLWPPFLERSRRLRELSLPWMCQATLPPLLDATTRLFFLERLDVRIRNPTPDWLRGTLLSALGGKRGGLCVCVYGPNVHNVHEHDEDLLRRLSALADAPTHARDTPPKPAWRRCMRLDDDDDMPHVSRAGFDCTTDAGHAAFEKARAAALHLWRCRPRRPPSARLPWQLGDRDYGSLPVDIIKRVWGLLDVRARIACIGVCRAWRAAFAPPDGWENLTLPADASPALLRLLAAQCAGLGFFDGETCTQLSKTDTHSFLWSVTNKMLDQVCLPSFGDDEGDQYSVDELEVLHNILAGCVGFTQIEADVCASDGPLLMAQLRKRGLRARTLVLTGGDGATWDLKSLLRCMQAVCGVRRRASAAEPLRRLSLCQLFVHWAPRSSAYLTDAQRYAELDVALGRLGQAQLDIFEAQSCRLTRRFVPCICALLRNGLSHLRLSDNPRLLRNSAQLLADGIRSGAQLSGLTMEGSFATQADVAAVLRGCVGHPVLDLLEVDVCSADGGHERAHEAAVVADALVALVAAGATALRYIRIFGAASAAQLAPMCDALRAGGHRVQSVFCDDAQLRRALAEAIATGRASQPPPQ